MEKSDTATIEMANESHDFKTIDRPGDGEKRGGKHGTMLDASNGLPPIFRDGIQLSPTPSDDPADPLNWKQSKKHYVLACVCYLAFLQGYSVTVIIPGYESIADEFSTSIYRVSFLVAASTICQSFIPLFFVPLSFYTGRRWMFLSFTFVSFIATIGCGVAQSYGGLMAARIFQGSGSAVWWGMAPAIVADCFYYHERGQKMGLYILCSYLGINVGPLCAGFVVENLGWRYNFWITTALTGFPFVLMLFTYPETLYNRHLATEQRTIRKTSYWQAMRPQLMPRSLESVPFYALLLQPFRMLQYPSVTLPGLYFGFHYMWKIGIGTTIPEFFTPIYGFSPAETGLVYIGFIVGAILGEVFAGRLSDVIVRRIARRNGGVYKEESRLHAVYLGALFCPTGLVILGVTLYKETHWIAPVVGLGVYNFGLEIIGTIMTTYAVDCYKSQAPEIGVVFSIFRNMCLGFFVTFFLPGFVELDTVLWAFCIPAICLWICFPVLILPLMIWGRKWHAHFGQPGLKEA